MAVMHDESVDEPADDMVSMREIVVDGRDGGDLGSSLGTRVARPTFFPIEKEKRPERFQPGHAGRRSCHLQKPSPRRSRSHAWNSHSVMRTRPSMNLTTSRSSQNRRAIWRGHALPGRKPDPGTGCSIVSPGRAFTEAGTREKEPAIIKESEKKVVESFNRETRFPCKTF